MARPVQFPCDTAFDVNSMAGRSWAHSSFSQRAGSDAHAAHRAEKSAQHITAHGWALRSSDTDAPTGQVAFFVVGDLRDNEGSAQTAKAMRSLYKGHQIKANFVVCTGKAFWDHPIDGPQRASSRSREEAVKHVHRRHSLLGGAAGGDNGTGAAGAADPFEEICNSFEADVMRQVPLPWFLVPGNLDHEIVGSSNKWTPSKAQIKLKAQLTAMHGRTFQGIPVPGEVPEEGSWQIPSIHGRQSVFSVRATCPHLMSDASADERLVDVLALGLRRNDASRFVLDAQRNIILTELVASSAQWKIVVGQTPRSLDTVPSNTKGQVKLKEVVKTHSGRWMEEMDPVFAEASAYIAGHQHIMGCFRPQGAQESKRCVISGTPFPEEESSRTGSPKRSASKESTTSDLEKIQEIIGSFMLVALDDRKFVTDFFVVGQGWFEHVRRVTQLGVAPDSPAVQEVGTRHEIKAIP